jgi:putative two-component system response regulator
MTSSRETAPPVILIADDEEANRKMLLDMLRRDGYEVLLAKDGEEAVSLFATVKVDLALLDVMMPGLTGFEVCRAIKVNPETRLVPVVLITGFGSANDRIEGIECGADDFLKRPIHREELSARVRSLLRLKQFTDELESAETVLFSLALSIEAKDPYTEGHCARLSKYSVGLASALGLPEDLRVALRRAGVVHDVGKVAVPESILLKPGPADSGREKDHGTTSNRRRANMRSIALLSPSVAHYSSSP